MQPEEKVKKFPGPKSKEMLDEFSRYVVMTPKPFVVDLSRSKGMYLATVDGQMLFDWVGYYGSKLIGHNHPGLLEPEYLNRLARAANNKVANPDFLTPECLEYYRLLYEMAPRCMQNDRLEIYAVNSGAEAVENMMKYLLSLYNEKRMKKGTSPGVRRFLYFDRAFHGRTVFALNITQLEHDPIVTKNFKGIIPGNIQVPFPSIDTSQPPSRNDKRTEQSLMIIEDCLKRYHEEIVAVVVEPIQGAGGQRVAKPEFFQRLSELTHKYDVFLAFDEVQTAGGQTGSMFAIDQFDLPHPPQAVAVAKKFANGVVYMLYPMKDRGVLDSTWGGNLADMVRWVQEIKIVKQDKLIEQVPEKAKVMIDGLNDLAKRYHNLIFNVRGMGLYQGFSLRRPADKSKLIQIALEDEQMLLLGAGVQTIRFRPVLDVTIDDIKLMLEKLDRCLAKLQAA
ncbi:MAG: aminotransferase class III-fold pyridoxal phosphate-dependent enzyme [Planctomycetes bacterium]|nr:aminotransferase class III-fold pyridoxal phosphate-dependent enzyme [Planctomycetota bacterium]